MRDVTAGGDAVVETAAGIVLAAGALPGERVRVRAHSRARGVAHGKILQLLEASPDRVSPPCSLAARCGGCALMSLSLAAQRALKRDRVARALGSLLPPGLPLQLVDSPRDLGYRARARLAWAPAHRGQRGAVIGYRRARGREVVDVARCAVLAAPLDRALTALRGALRDPLRGRGELLLGSGPDQSAVAMLRSDEAQPEAVYRALEALARDATFAGIALEVMGTGAATWGDPRHAAALGPSPSDPLLRSAVDGFAQANFELNPTLVKRVIELAQPDGCHVLELYAGHGNFTLELARRSASLTAVEADPGAARALRDNARAHGIDNLEVRVADAGSLGPGQRVDLVVLDPPRSGARPALEAVVSRKPQRIIYVSCDVQTLARDLRQLIGDGRYRVDAAIALDMFPHTPHIECLVRLRGR